MEAESYGRRALGHALRGERHVEAGNVHAAMLHFGRAARYARQARGAGGGVLATVQRAETAARNAARAIKETVEREATPERLGTLAGLAAVGVTGAVMLHSMRGQKRSDAKTGAIVRVPGEGDLLRYEQRRDSRAESDDFETGVTSDPETESPAEGSDSETAGSDPETYGSDSESEGSAEGSDPESPRETQTGGIINYGATCYINATLQCLLAVPEFEASGSARGPYAAIKAAIESGRSPSSDEIAALRDAANERRGGRGGDPKFAENTHEDMQEFMKAISEDPRGPFAFQIASVYSCHKTYDGFPSGAEYTSTNEEGAQEIFLPLGDGAETSMVELMGEFFAWERMSDEHFKKELCTETNRIKRLLLAKAPKFLVVHQKRFMNEGGRMWKADRRVMFDETLDLGPFASQKNLYELIAVSVHRGTKECGHYWAFVKKNGKWAKYNDERVESVNFDTVLKEGKGGARRPSAYVLLYRKGA